VLPDGSTASEVIGPDGNVVFEAGPDIPDSGLLHNYDFSAGSTTKTLVEDQEGAGDLDTGSITEFGTINGKQAGSFAKSDSIAGDFDTVLSEPFDVFIVGRFDSLTSNNIALDGFAEFVHAMWVHDPDEGGLDFQIFQGSGVESVVDGDTNNHLFTTKFGSTDTHRIDQTEVVSGDAGANDLSGLTVADDHESRGFGADCTIGQVLVYDPTTNGYDATEVESSLVSIWGL